MKNFKTLLGTQNAKTIKGEDLNVITGIMYLAPADLVKGLNLCPFASKGCKQACLFTAGRGKFNNVKDARYNKTVLFRDNLEFFMESLVNDISKNYKSATRKGKQFAVRLNGTSDISWESYKNKDGKNIFEIFPNIQFYDYTKNFTRIEALTGKWSNYHLTFSMSESKRNQIEAIKLLNLGVNVAVVFSSELPENFKGFKVIDGDKHDLRFLDPKGGFVVGLKAKGEAKKDKSGFVQDSNSSETIAA